MKSVKNKKSKVYILTSFIILFLVFGISIGYSAFNTKSMVKDISLDVRVPSDIRVTAFEVLSSSNKGVSNYTEYSISSVMTGISLPSESSSVKYKVEVTNFEGPEMGIFSINNLPDNLQYELSGYNLKDKICDDSKCSLGVVKEFYITISYKSGSFNSDKTVFDLKLNLQFEAFHSISYVNVSNNSYPTSVINGDSFTISLPSSNYILDKITKSDGSLLSTSDYTYNDLKLTIKSVEDDLVIKFEVAKPLKDLVLDKYEVNKTSVNFANNVTDESNSGVFTTTDESGNLSYYFRGVINDNYVSFANKLWRIVRINGDGSYRLILEGTAGTSLFYSTSSTTVNNTDYASSTIKTFLEDWYTSNISSYENYIDKNAIFWSDRSYSSSNETSSQRFYNGRVRLLASNPPKPTLVPINSSDMFSVSGASKGNKSLSKPIGLITGDEVVFAGGSYNYGGSTTYYTNESYYLYTDLGSNKVYGMWTMTPAWFNKSSNTYSTIIVSKPQASVYYEPPGISKRSVRPVINLKSTVTFSGSGTYDDPYEVVGY